jgi:hypothetical protein
VTAPGAAAELEDVYAQLAPRLGALA